SSASSSPPTVRATRMVCAPSPASARAAARPMPRDAPVMSAMRPDKRPLMIQSRKFGQKRKLVFLAAIGIAGLDRIVAGETGVAEMRRFGIALCGAHGAIEPVHGDKGKTVRIDEPAHL